MQIIKEIRKSRDIKENFSHNSGSTPLPEQHQHGARAETYHHIEHPKSVQIDSLIRIASNFASRYAPDPGIRLHRPCSPLFDTYGNGASDTPGTFSRRHGLACVKRVIGMPDDLYSPATSAKTGKIS